MNLCDECGKGVGIRTPDGRLVCLECRGARGRAMLCDYAKKIGDLEAHVAKLHNENTHAQGSYADELGALKAERDDLLRENAKLRRALEETDRRLEQLIRLRRI